MLTLSNAFRVSLFLGLLLTPRLALAGRLLDAPPFSIDADALLQMAESLAGPADDAGAVDILLSHTTRTLRRDGTTRLRLHSVYRIRTSGEPGVWQSLRYGYSAAHEARPVLRARVITPNGKTFNLSEKAIVESAGQNMNGEVYGDNRVIGGPLPAIRQGAIVETLIEVEDTRAFFAAGTVYRDWEVVDAPVLEQQLDVEVDDGIVFSQKINNLPTLKTSKRAVAGGTVYTYRVAPAPRLDLSTLEAGVPLEVTQIGQVSYATGTSWNSVASAYAKRVDAAIAASDRSKLKTILASVPASRDQRAYVRALTAALQQHVRYTGVELGAAAIEPARPDESLARQYGDCKDQATLLVALLRETGITAHVALLSASTHRDVSVDLPGMGAFNHAITYVPSLDMWIDTTSDVVAAGDLPYLDRGRLSLIASASSKTLIKTPVRVAAENHDIESVELRLPENGKADVTLTFQGTGIHAELGRSHIAQRNKTQWQEVLKSVCSGWDSEPITHSAVAANDFSQPYEVEYRCKGTGYATSYDIDATAVITPIFAFESLGDKWAKPEPKDKRKPRRNDYMLIDPTRGEVRFRIVAAPGYEAKDLPPSIKQSLGAFTFRREVSSTDNVAHVTFIVEQPKMRLTAKEHDATLDAIEAFLKKESTLTIRFVQIGEQLSKDGKLKEAIAEFRRLGRLHPKEGRHLAQEAMLLTEAGLGSDARERIEAALAREPNGAYVQRMAGWIYLRDSYGRFAVADWERERALKHLRRAKALDYTDDLTRVLLIEGLERNNAGELLGEGANVSEALAEYRDLRTDFADQWTAERTVDLARTLFAMKRYTEVLTELGTGQLAGDALSFAIASELMTKGTQAGLAAIGTRATKENMGEGIGSAVLLLINHRHYQQARDLCLRLVQLAPAAEREMAPMMTMLRDLKPFDPKKLPREAEPITATRRMIYDLLLGNDDPATLARLTSLIGADSGEDPKKAMKRVASSFKRAVAGSGLDTRAIADLAANMPYTLEGNDQVGYRVSAMKVDEKKANWTVYHRVGGQLRLVGSITTLPALGEAALRKLGAGDLVAARTLLLWAKSERPMQLGWLTPESDKRQMALAATLLTIETKPNAQAMLSKLCTKAVGDGEKIACTSMLAGASADARRYKDAIAYAKEFLLLKPDNAWMKDLLLRSQAAAGELDATSSTEAAIEVALTSARNGDLAGAERAMLALHKAGKATERLYNELAWLQLFLRDPTEDTLNFARRAAEAKGARASYWHTLATIQASRGELLDARNSLFKSMDMRMSDGPEEHDHYVLGRIADGLGLTETALAHYAKAAKQGSSFANDTSKLAERRLAQLEKTSKKQGAQASAMPAKKP